LTDCAHAAALGRPLATLGATLAANDARGTQVALDRVRHLLADRRGATAADVERSVIELAVDGPAAAIRLR
jgi:hypothetical protein